jgi:zinc protease
MTRTMLSLGILAAVTLAAPEAIAQQKEMPPPVGQPKPFRLPERRSFTLDNGMHVSMVPFGTVPKVFVRLAIMAGNVDEKPDQIWLADVAADLLQEGTTTRSAAQIASDAASMGGSLAVNVGPDRSNVTGDVLGTRGPDFVRLVADVVRHPRFPESELPRIIANRVRQLAIAQSQPQAIASERFAKLVFGDHPCGRTYPTEAMLESYTIDQVRGFWRDNVGAARAHLYVTGVYDPAAMERAIRDAFGDWERGPAPTTAAPPPAPTSRTVALIDRPDAVQSTIYLGLRVPGPSDPNWVPLEVTNSLLGGAFGSRITTNIREQKGYTYSPFSYFNALKEGTYWAEAADVTTNVTGPSLTEIFGEIDRLQREAPPEAELRGIQNNMAGTFVLQNSSRSGVAGRLAYVDLYGLGDDYLRDYVQNVLAVTPEQVRAMTARYLRPEQMQLVVVGDRKVVEEQLAKWGTVVP